MTSVKFAKYLLYIFSIVLFYYGVLPVLYLIPPPSSQESVVSIVSLFAPGLHTTVEYGKACDQNQKNCIDAFIYRGAFTKRSDKKFAQRLQELVEQHPQTKIVCFDSPGGRVKEAAAIAKEIKRRKFDTCVADMTIVDSDSNDTKIKYTDQCQSACPLVILSGINRIAVGQHFKIGLHSLSSPYYNFGLLDNNDYKKDGVDGFSNSIVVSNDVLEKILDTAFLSPSDRMYIVPTKEQFQLSIFNKVNSEGQGE